MSSAVHEAVVLRPPSPRLGNFNHIFDHYLQQASGTEPRINISELYARLDEIGKADAQLANKRQEKQYALGFDGADDGDDKNKGSISEIPSPKTFHHISDFTSISKPSSRLAKAARGLLSGTTEDFKPSPLQDAAEVDASPAGSPAGSQTSSTFTSGHHVPHSSPETSDTMLHRQSVFDQTPWQDVRETTPLTSPDAVHSAQPVQYTPIRKTSQLPQVHSLFTGTSYTATNTYDYSSVGLSGFQAVRYHATSVKIQGNCPFLNHVSINGTQGVSISGAGIGFSGAACSSDDMNYSPNGLFRYQPCMFQPVPGVELYSVEAAESGVDRITPHYMCTKDEKMRVLECKLQQLVKLDRLIEATAPATNNVHVFVDLSNITIGFYDCLKATHNIPVTRRMRAPKFCFDHLALILERGRNVEKRVVAGSLDSTYSRKWPTFMQEAKDLDYEMCIMQRVAKAVMPTTKNKRLSTQEPEWTASDANSSSEETFLGQLKQGEQGVDEVLHLKMLQSAVDDEPGTAVLATGDAAEAEFSDGFKRNVERLLNKGWNVEILGWSKGISKAWREAEFVAQYGDRVRVIELDIFVEELFGAWFGAPGGY